MYWCDRLCQYVIVHPSPDTVVSSYNLRTSQFCTDVLRRFSEQCEVWDYFVSSVSIGNIVKLVCSFVLGIYVLGLLQVRALDVTREATLGFIHCLLIL
jgi:hypothetical protein